MTRRTWLVVGVALAVVVAAVVVVALVSSGSSSSSTSVSSGSVTVLPAASTTVAAGSEVVVAMGHLDDPSNTFYELFDRTTGATSWALATPPGVADNGGLVVGPADDGTVTAGFLPSADLTFSVLARRSAGAAADGWVPGSLPGALAPTPDALATGADGGATALLGRPATRVVAADSGLSTWAPVTTAAALATVSTQCAVSALTAVARVPDGTTMVGAACPTSTRVGLFTRGPGSGWSLLGPLRVPGATGGTRVLRLQSSTAGITALAEGTGASGTLVAAWGDGTGVVASAPLTVPAGWTVLGTAVGGGTGRAVTVLLGADGGTARRVEQVDVPVVTASSSAAGAGGWRSLPTPPAGTAAVAAVGDEVDAFVVGGSHLAVWSDTGGASSWTQSGHQTVPLPYGSSS